MSGNQRLINLLELANQGPAMRAALAEEVAELLADWPADCPAEMRGPCEALLARAAREVDVDTRARLRMKVDTSAVAAPPRETPDRALVETARRGQAMAPRLAQALEISAGLAEKILRDDSGHALAVAAKALGLNRAAFSSLVLLAGPERADAACYQRLDAFDALTAVEASRELRRWSSEIAA